MQLYRGALVIAMLATLGACDPAPTDIIEKVVLQLEEYATGVRLSSGVTKEDLITMVDVWNMQPEDVRAIALESIQYKLLFHFAIVPTERIRKQLDDIVVAIAHIHRIERAYKRFRPAYLGLSIDNAELGGIKMSKLMNVFTKLTKNEPCTLRDFELANMEHLGWLARYQDIVTYEDVYANLDEMRNILNYHNGDLVKPLHDYVFPQLGKTSDPAVLQQLYYDKLYENTRFRFNEQGQAVRSL